MGAPKRNRKKYERPAAIWNKQRIEEEHKLKSDYGLKNLRELWKVTSEIRRIRRNIRAVLSGNASEETGRAIVSRLANYNIIKGDAVLDDLLIMKPESILERRLQTMIYRKGMAKSLRQSRQLITHGFISINGRKARSPGYWVKSNEESGISYYKPINIETVVSTQPQAGAAAPHAEAPTEAKEASGGEQ